MLNSVSSGRLSTFFLYVFLYFYFFISTRIYYVVEYAMFHNLLAHIGLHTLDQIKYSMDNIAQELHELKSL